MALFVLCKLILQTHNHPVRLDVWFLDGPFVYFHTSCMWTAKTLARLRGCAGSPESLLVALCDKYHNFLSWLKCLFCSNGFNILLYGLGSKRNMIEDFRTSMLSDFSHLVVNGYFPSLTIKHVSLKIGKFQNKLFYACYFPIFALSFFFLFTYMYFYLNIVFMLACKQISYFSTTFSAKWIIFNIFLSQ